jgi:hypothetical protein
MTILAVFGFGALLLITGIWIGFFLLIPLIIVAFAIGVGYVAGREIDTHFSIRPAKYILPVAIVGVATAWGFLGYREFKFLCSSAPMSIERREEHNPQAGFLFDDSNLRMFEIQKSIQTPDRLYEQGKITYFDEVFLSGFGLTEKKIGRHSANFKSNVAEPPSDYVFQVSPIEKVANRWHSPIFRVKYSVVAVKSGRQESAQSEYIFGGGIVGLYMHAVLGARGDYSDQDFQYLSCGYASRVPAAWRPRFRSNPNFENYFLADIDLLRSILP